jgi:hypothetical protein
MIHKIQSAEVKTIYLDLIWGSGYYRHRPGKPPYICLGNSLLENGSEGKHQEVFNVLLEYHRSIPVDSIYRSFVIVRYYEDLVPAPAPVPEPAPEPVFEQPLLAPVLEEDDKPEIIVIGRAIRHREFVFYEFIHPAPEPHIIG